MSSSRVSKDVIRLEVLAAVTQGTEVLAAVTQAAEVVLSSVIPGNEVLGTKALVVAGAETLDLTDEGMVVTWDVELLGVTGLGAEVVDAEAELVIA